MSKLILLTMMWGLALANPVRRTHYHAIDGVIYSSGYGNQVLPQPLEPKQHDPVVVFSDEIGDKQVCKKLMIRSIYPNIFIKVTLGENDIVFPTDKYILVKQLFKENDAFAITQNDTILETYTKQDVFKMMNIEDFNNFDDFVQFYFDNCN